MSDREYEYRGLVARCWDFLRGDTTDFPDRGYFRDIILESGEPALLVGCGTGRLLLEYLRDGLDVEGMDISPEMLELCMWKAKAESLDVKTYRQSMESMKLDRQYRTIIVPSSSFQLVPDLEEARATLKGFFHHLSHGGILSMSIWVMEASGNEWSEWYLVTTHREQV